MLRENTIARRHSTDTESVSARFGARAETVYRALLRRHRWRVADLADTLDLDETEVRALLGELRAEGLVVGSADDTGAVRAVEPGLALAGLASRRVDRCVAGGAGAVGTAVAGRGELRSGVGRLGGGCRTDTGTVLDRCASLEEWFAERAGQWMRLDGMDEVATLVEGLVIRARHETVLLTPSYLPGSFEFRPQIGETVIRRGATLKTVWGSAVLDAPAAVRYARSRGARWPAPRAAQGVDVRAVIIDRSYAVVLGKPGHAQMLSGGPAFESLLTTADYLWEHSIELRPATGTGDTAQRPRHEMVLRLLAEGHTDQAIARRIGVSVRTVRNDVALVMGSLGARSRFQAGVRAMCLGLLLS
jgi:DNA-binding CsgD family transcriptional regulator